MGSNDAVTVMITLRGDRVATRFDLCTELLIANIVDGAIRDEPRTMLLSGASADEICGIAIKENVSLVVTGGMEDAHFQYLRWKKITVIDRVAGDVQDVLPLIVSGMLKEGLIVRQGERK